MKVWRYRPGPGHAWLYSDSPDYLVSDLRDMQEKDRYEVECIEMSEKALEDLDQHEGW